MATEKVGILALQGDFALHQTAFESLGAEVTLVKDAAGLDRIGRLVIPGGEATTIQLLMDKFGLREPMIEFGRQKPLWGTCAGLLLLASDVDDTLIRPLKLIGLKALRNAYGSQAHSFVAEGDVSLKNTRMAFEMVFIRAPRIAELRDGTTPLGWLGDEVTMAQQGHVLVSTFHPELTDDTSIHEYFLNL